MYIYIYIYIYKHFGELDDAAELLFLQPQDADVEVPNPSNSLSLEYAERRGGVDMQSYSKRNAEVVGQ